jgi:hypothetical protein
MIDCAADIVDDPTTTTDPISTTEPTQETIENPLIAIPFIVVSSSLILPVVLKRRKK